MKVILLKELRGKGGEGDIVDVATGYAVNYLFPNSIAIEATKGNIKQLEMRRHNIDQREGMRLDSAEKMVAALESKAVRIPAKVGEEGQLFGSVTTIQIASVLTELHGVEIDRKGIELRQPIKNIGEFPVVVTIYRDIKATVQVLVVDENAPEEIETNDGLDEAVDGGVDETTDATDDMTEEVADELAEVAAAETEESAEEA